MSSNPYANLSQATLDSLTPAQREQLQRQIQAYLAEEQRQREIRAQALHDEQQRRIGNPNAEADYLTDEPMCTDGSCTILKRGGKIFHPPQQRKRFL